MLRVMKKRPWVLSQETTVVQGHEYVAYMYTCIIQLQEVTNAFRVVDSDEFYGVIGPSDPAEAEFWAPIFQRSNLLTVSLQVMTDTNEIATTTNLKV